MNSTNLNCSDTADAIDYGYDRPSKSQVKRDMYALLELGKTLIELPANKLKQLPLEERLFEAINLASRTKTREGKRRQVHYVGKLMRAAPVVAIRAQLDTWANGSSAETLIMHRLEELRAQLLIEDHALTRLLATHPQVDIQALRTQIRGARKEATTNAKLLAGQAPQNKHYRAVFQTLKALQAMPGSAPTKE